MKRVKSSSENNVTQKEWNFTLKEWIFTQSENSLFKSEKVNFSLFYIKRALYPIHSFCFTITPQYDVISIHRHIS